MPKNEAATLPKGWPSQIFYLTAPCYSQTIREIHSTVLRSRPRDCQGLPPNIMSGPSSLVKISPIASATHPAYGQFGLFAARDLKPGSFVLQYLGEVHAPTGDGMSGARDAHASSDYDLSLDREHGIGIDADRRGNEARFINDYRGIADKPNAEFKEIWDEKRGERGMGVWVLGVGKSGKGKGVRKGEEILVSYGRGFWGARRTGAEG